MRAHDPLARLLAAWLAATVLLCAAVKHRFSLDGDGRTPEYVVASVWSGGALVERAILAAAAGPAPALDVALAAHPGATRVHEVVVGEGPVIAHPDALFAMSFVPGRDGVKATVGDRTEYLTPDDLLARQAYDRGVEVASLGFRAGVDLPVVLAILSERFAMTAPDLMERARFRRFRVRRELPGQPPPRAITAESMTEDDVRQAVIAAARFLARGVDSAGRYRFVIDAPTNRDLPGYDWPRHSGATYFLAQAAAVSGDPQIGAAAVRAATFLRDHAIGACGEHKCVGTDDVVDVGSTALAVIAFVEIARSKLDRSFAEPVPDLAEFLRSQQRPDGDLMHQYDRQARRPVDVQFLYYTGEAALALSRAAGLTGDARDREAASRALARLTGPGWSFFGSRYYFGEEHWTCQAMEDLWDTAPNPYALDFCLRWQAYDRRLQYGAGDTPYDADGAYGFGPIVTPRLTPVGSRCEAGVATLDAAARGLPQGAAASGLGAAPVPAGELARLDGEMRRSLAVLLRHQVGSPAFPKYLLAAPDAVDGAMPASEVDWQLRVDYAQHAGSALVRWLSRSRGPASASR